MTKPRPTCARPAATWKPDTAKPSSLYPHPDLPQLLLHRRAARYFDRLDDRLRVQRHAKLEALARDPQAAVGVKPMQGEWNGFYRPRHGGLRVIYTLDSERDAVVIAHIGPRGDAYK